MFTRPFALTAIGNTAAFWNHEQLGIELKPGIDEVSLALVADAWSRTYRSQRGDIRRARPARCKPATAFASCPIEVAASWPAARLLPEIGERKACGSAGRTLRGITARYGTRTADFVAMQLEYPRNRATQ